MTEPTEFWLPLVDEPIGTIVKQIQRENPDIDRLVATPQRILAFRTFAYLRVGILLGSMLVEHDVEGDEWVDRLLEDPRNRARVVDEVRAVAEEIAADPRRAGDEPIGPDDGARERFRELAKRSLGELTLRALAPLVAAVLVAAGATGATHAADPLRAVGVQVAVPGDAPVQAAAGTAFEPSFAYPDDGSAVRTGVIVTSVEGSASAEVSDVSLFGGAVRASLAAARADGPELRDLVVLGRPISPTDGQSVQLADWGVATLLDDTAGSVTAIDIRLTSHHAGLPAGTEIAVAHVDVPLPDTTSTVGILTPAPEPKIAAAPSPKLPARPPEPSGPVTVRRPPPGIHPRLTAGRYVFPVYGEVAVGDTFGAARADVGYHHGDDLFAPAGTPVLAVADGRVYSVGWNRLGGNRLWLQDGQGNQFYYAHLSAFAPAARNRASVRAGTVLGFVGNSGDADGTPYHLHFEVHPVSLLYLGEDGAVDPTPYLVAWQRLRDISLTPAQGWVPPAQTSTPAPLPGAVLVASADISTASGLVPGTLQAAISRALPGDPGAPPAARPTASRPAPSTTPPRRAGRG